MKNYYIVAFEPAEYGVIKYKTYSRKEAYTLYHKLKKTMEDRPGRVYAMEYLHIQDNEYKSQYLCSIRTGKHKDGKYLVDQMMNNLKDLQAVYNQQTLERRIDALSELELNIIHGIELLDTSKLTAQMEQNIVDNIQITSAARRGNKHLLADAKSINPKLRELYSILKSVSDKLDNNKSYRAESKGNGKKATNDKEARNKYFTALGINIEAYESDDLENMINKDAIVSLLKKINE